MVYKYTRKTNHVSWKEGDMEKAIQEAALGSLNSVASKYNIPYAILYRHVKTGSAEKKLGRFGTVFNKVQENQLVECMQTMDTSFYGLTRDEFITLAFDFAEKKWNSSSFSKRKSW
ncbi:hypothetical protein PR048_029161 [Dryococelus australis]|uniref:HTH psq-type domain-containing protein n=1 Tax=Dryococelus australis TaxID=614101 RepID=A0ABQ9GFW2_9NEOP|nr:hypothetical protein PR048_029161 [Dryococelus australis]